MGRCGEDVTEIDVKPDGSWRAKNDKEHLELTQWHGKNIKPDLENSKQLRLTKINLSALMVCLATKYS
ncbi:hypothetical protein MKW92_014629 [Papaver armeniacum]|nr:hypothetical protein MKW92_014629 [Papaver armeniacum]